jgi:uncharacterized protein DUF4157
MPLRREGDHWRWVGGPVPPGADAITIGPVVSVRRAASGDERLLRHELEHVRQWRALGPAGFLRRYVGAYLHWRLRGYGHWAAYRRIPLEVEAEWAARRARS